MADFNNFKQAGDVLKNEGFQKPKPVPKLLGRRVYMNQLGVVSEDGSAVKWFAIDSDMMQILPSINFLQAPQMFFKPKVLMHTP